MAIDGQSWKSKTAYANYDPSSGALFVYAYTNSEAFTLALYARTPGNYSNFVIPSSENPGVIECALDLEDGDVFYVASGGQSGTSCSVTITEHGDRIVGVFQGVLRYIDVFGGVPTYIEVQFGQFDVKVKPAGG